MDTRLAAGLWQGGVAPPTFLERLRQANLVEGVRDVIAALRDPLPPADPARIPSRRIEARAGDTVERLASEFGTTAEQIRFLNPELGEAGEPRTGDTIRVPLNRQVVQVAEGDTLDSLARRYGVPVEHLAAVNGLSRRADLEVGERITIPPERAFGLDCNAAVRAFIDEVRPLGQRWSALSEAERLNALEEAVNNRLRSAGVPEVTLTTAGVRSNGVYNFTRHEIGINPAAVARGTISDPDLARLADTLYHEARHAEQWFDMARLEVARGRDPAVTMGIEASVAEAAADAPRLDPDSARGRFIDAMYESVYGAGRNARNAILRNLNPATYELYRALPEEADAWRVGGKVLNLWPR